MVSDGDSHKIDRFLFYQLSTRRIVINLICTKVDHKIEDSNYVLMVFLMKSRGKNLKINCVPA